jgi:predicted phage terminase large subunit-like protein
VTPEHIPTLGPAILFLDLAASKRVEADHSVIVAGRQFGGLMHVCDVRAGKYSPLQLANHTIDMVLRHRPVRVMIEGTAAGNYFIEYLRVIAASKGMFLPIEAIKVSNTKDAKHLRISAVEGVLSNGSLCFLAGLPGWDDIVEQFTEFPRGRHDDEIDTISLMVQYYTQNSEIFMHRPKQTLTQYITRPTPVSDFVQQNFESTDDETCGSDFV